MNGGADKPSPLSSEPEPEGSVVPPEPAGSVGPPEPAGSGFSRLDDPMERMAEERARRWYELGRSPNVIIRQAYRMIVLVVGLTVVAGGIAMFVLPGPGILVVIAGLAILATEFVWARLLLQRAKLYAKKAKEKTMGKGGLGSLKRKVTRKS